VEDHVVTANHNVSPILNIVPIKFNSDTIEVGRLSNFDSEAYRQLREQYWQTHSFRYDNRTKEVLNVTLTKEAIPLGSTEVVKIQEHLLLMARAVQQNILIWLANRRPILRSNKRLVFWGQADNALLLSRAVQNLGLEPVKDLEVALRYDIDCRMFGYEENKLYLGLVIDVATSNVIDIPVSQLHMQGMSLVDRYVCHHKESDREFLRPRLELLGRISKADGGKIWLTDTEGISEVDANDVYLEPRLENLHDVIKLYYKQNASKVLNALEEQRLPVSSAAGKLTNIRNTLAALKNRSVYIGNSVSVELGNLLSPADEKFPDRITTVRPPLLFGAQGRTSGTIPDLEISKHGPYLYMQHERNSPIIAVICESQYKGVVEQFVKLLVDGVPNEIWEGTRPNPFPDGLAGKYRLAKIRLEYEECKNPTPQAYQEAVNRILRRLTDLPDLALIQTRKSFLNQYGDSNPYLVSKATFMMSDVPTQAVHIENIDMPIRNQAYLLSNVALAMYAKLDGTPWVISTRSPTTHELVVGLGATEVSGGRLEAKTRYVGITSVFQGDGRYLVWGATREVEFEEYAAALLETLKNIIRYVQQHNIWENGDKVRLVFHVYKRLRDCEVEAIKALVNELATAYLVEFAFLDISWAHPYHIFDPTQQGVSYWDLEARASKIKGENVPDRGLCLQLDKRRALLQLTGPRELKTAGQGIPQPLLVELHPDSDFIDMTYLLRQIYHFTYMSWRSFFPGGEPVTITYSRLIAKLLGNLKTTHVWSSQVLMGSLRDRRWFL
jgi:hypothetical protein